MHLDSDDLVAQFERDWPQEAEISKLRALVAAQQREIQRLTALVPTPTDGYGRPFPENLEQTRHDLTVA